MCIARKQHPEYKTTCHAQGCVEILKHVVISLSSIISERFMSIDPVELPLEFFGVVEVSQSV
jgi:hypothetical protein